MRLEVGCCQSSYVVEGSPGGGIGSLHFAETVLCTSGPPAMPPPGLPTGAGSSQLDASKKAAAAIETSQLTNNSVEVELGSQLGRSRFFTMFWKHFIKIIGTVMHVCFLNRAGKVTDFSLNCEGA